MTKMRPLVAGVAVFAALGSALVSGTALADTVKIAFIDPLSGLMAPVGQNQLKSWQYVADMANQKGWAGAHKFEVVDPKVQLYGDIGILTLRYDAYGTAAEPLSRWKATSVYHRANDQWRIVHAHWSLVKEGGSSRSSGP